VLSITITAGRWTVGREKPGRHRTVPHALQQVAKAPSDSRRVGDHAAVGVAKTQYSVDLRETVPVENVWYTCFR
jgi:hypothetical protein